MRVLVVGSITRDTNVYDGVAHHAFGGTALFAARTYRSFGVDVRLVTRLAADDRAPVAAELGGVELIAQPSAATTTFENRYGADDERTQRLTAMAPAIEHRADYFTDVDWLHLGPLHPHDLAAQWLTASSDGPTGLDLQGFARRIDAQRVVAEIDPRVVDLLPRVTWLKASRDEWHALHTHLGIAPPQRSPRGAAETLVTDGAAGGTALRNGQRDVHWSAAPPVENCDPTGAGDVFFAAYLYHRAGRRTDVARATLEAARYTSAFLLNRRAAD